MEPVRRLKLTLIIVFMFLAVPSYSSGANDSAIKGFEIDTTVEPPSLPGEEADTVNVKVLLNEPSGQLIRNAHIFINLKNPKTQEEVGSLQFSVEGTVSFYLKKGRWTGVLAVDESSVLGSDYFAILDVTATEDTTIVPNFVLVGSVRGEVYDNKKRLVSDAKIRLECKQYIPSHITSDEFGIFFAEYIAPGECRMAAMHEKKVGFTTATIEAGKPASVEITLDKEVAGSSNKIIFTGLILILLISSVVIYARKRGKSAPLPTTPTRATTQSSRKKQKRKHKAEKAPIKKKAAEYAEDKLRKGRINDVMKTLKERERAVVNFLLENSKDFESTQAKIRYGTNIPKTSLMRIFDSLSARNIVKVQKVGKAKKVRLTNWLLGKEQKEQTQKEGQGAQSH